MGNQWPMAFVTRIVGAGLVAGAVGTAAMDLVWFKRQRDQGGTASFVEWEFGAAIKGFDDAPAPGKVGQIAARAVNVELPDTAAATTTNVIHWSTGLTWGVVAAALASIPHVGGRRAGFVAGVAAWTTSYAVLPMLGVYKPINEYDTKTLLKDFTAHLTFGSAVGSTLALLGGRRRHAYIS
jgi:hypothetical protein